MGQWAEPEAEVEQARQKKNGQAEMAKTTGKCVIIINTLVMVEMTSRGWTALWNAIFSTV